jgi:hypothetical protein
MLKQYQVKDNNGAKNNSPLDESEQDNSMSRTID